MRHALLLASGFWLLGASVAETQAQGPAASLPEGTFASTQEGCTKLEKKTPAELGEDLDFQVLSKKGLTAYQQICDFVNVFAHDATSWVATAFCDEAGYTYPDVFSIKQKDGGTLNVTRITDMTERSSDDSSSDSSDSDSSDQADSDGNKEGASGKSSPADEQADNDSYSTFVKCQTVKP
jgi:hypothetical protein